MENPPSGAYSDITCPNCGYYAISYSVLSDMQESLNTNRHLIAGYLHETNSLDVPRSCIITSDKLDSILVNPLIPKTTMQKLEKLLLYFYKQNEYIGQEHQIGTDTPVSIAYAKNYDELLTGAFITYLYLNHGIKNFFVVAPNLTVYNKLMAAMIMGYRPGHLSNRKI